MQELLDQYSINDFLSKNFNKKIVFTNGCFDLLHPGHIHYLSEAKALGDILIVGLNSDASVKKIKGSDRPINDQLFRATMLLGLKPVDVVVIFDEETPVKILSIIKPSIHVKGGDYNVKTLPEYPTVIENGGTVKSLSFLDGYSSTNIIKRLLNKK